VATSVEVPTVPAAPVASPTAAQARGLGFKAMAFVVVVLALVLAWEGYKALPVDWPIRSDNRSMPHTWDIVGSLFEPAQRGANTDSLLVVLLRSALFTWREAAVGFLMGSTLGFGLAVLFVRVAILERGLMPYVVASQTVPLIAIAPLVVIWSGRVGWPSWFAVAVISAYLTFFPVTINTLRGLRSPQPVALELMRTYAASGGDVLWKLRVPAALPYVFTALKISATASVIGAIVGEFPAGIADGLGRALLTFSYYYSSGPEKLYAAILISAALGIVFVTVVTGAERLVLKGGRPDSE
jgi:NitT/TauT family transport system permease protein